MIRGIYTSAAGMLMESTRLEVAGNNLANVNTTGFKKDTVVAKAFPEMLVERVNDPQGTPALDRPVVIGRLGTGVCPAGIFTQHTQGQLRSTGNPYDLALTGEGFFTVQTPQGVLYTRNGNFTVDHQGQLVTQEGYPVLGQAGPLLVEGKKCTVDTKGNVYLDGELADTLRIVGFTSLNALQKVGNGFYRTAPENEAGTPSRYGVQQGFLENANVNTVSEMVDMISITRAYEANAKVLQVQDEMLGKAVNDVGRV